MPVFLIVSVCCQILCGLHVIKTGQERYWLYLIVIAPILGCVIYVLAVIIPAMLGSRGGKKTLKTLQNTINPTRNLPQLRAELSLRDTAQSRTNLADELMQLGQYEEAITHYKQALTGSNAFNPESLLKLAQAQFELKDYSHCLESLTTLLKNNPGYVSQEGHLLQARALQEQGEISAAEESYQQIITYYSGPAARYHYATLLVKQNRIREAKEQLEEIQSYERIAPKFYKNFHKDCLHNVRQLLKSIESGRMK